MPNWVVTKIIAKDSTVLLDKMVNGLEECVDFNELIPMSEDLKISSGSFSIEVPSKFFVEETNKRMEKEEPIREALSKYYDDSIDQSHFLFKALNDKEVCKMIKHIRGYKEHRRDNNGMSRGTIKEALVTYIKGYFNLKRYGFKDWYDWSIANWGTKWNANDSVVGTDIIEFQTAWNTPMPILMELAKYTDIRVLYADEDRGCNCGMFDLIKNDKGEVELHELLGESEYLATVVWDNECPVIWDEDGYGIVEDENDERYTNYMKEYMPVYDMITKAFRPEMIGTPIQEVGATC